MKNQKILTMMASLMFAMPALVSAGTITGKVQVKGTRDHSNAVVYIASAPGQFAPQDSPRMNQTSLSFQPAVLPIVVGTTVQFQNSDAVLHNVFTPSAAGDHFNLGSWPKGQSKPYTFTKLGRVELLCNVHQEMHASILVLQNPFFSVTDKEGNFRIQNVPAGTYTLKVWHERGTGPAQTITVATGSQAVNFEITSR